MQLYLIFIFFRLSPQEFINPHRSILGRGNYNINIIMKAVQLKEHEAVWFDKRRPITIINFNKIKGFILNVPSDYKIAGIFALPWERKHWIAVTKIKDSKTFLTLFSSSLLDDNF